MYAGHAAMGIALFAHARDRRRRIAALAVGASLAADLGWCALTLARVEGGHSLGSQAVHAPRLPWSHSLASTVVIALVFALAGAAIADRTARTRVALMAIVAVVVHWIFGDVPFGEGFPLTPWSTPLATPHLYATWPVAFVVELAVVTAGVLLAARALGKKRATALLAMLGLLHVAAWAPTFVGSPAIDLDAEPLRILAYAVLLLAAFAACVLATPRRRDGVR